MFAGHLVKISQNPTNQNSCQLPIELYDEIISFLWNDFPSLKACALANRVLVAPSQKRLFYCIALCGHFGVRYQKSAGASSSHESVGTPSSFYWLLTRSPHLAEYVQALHILPGSGDAIVPDVELSDMALPVLGNEHDLRFEDYKVNGEEISDLDHTIQL